MTGYISPYEYGNYVPEQGFIVNNKRRNVFNATNLQYSFDESNNQDFNISFPLSDKFFTNNYTMNLHVEITADMDPSERFELENPVFKTHRSISLIKFSPKIEKKKLMNLLGETIEEGTEKVEEPIINEDMGVKDILDHKKYIHHLKPDIYCYFTPDFTTFQKGAIPDQMKHLYVVNYMYNYYEPIVVWSDFWIYSDILIPLNNTISHANVTVHILPYSLMKVSMLFSFENTNSIYREYGISSDLDTQLL